MQNASNVKDIVQIARDSASFYTEAMQKVDDPHIKSMFSSMAQHKQRIIDSLSEKLKMGNEIAPEHGTVAGTIRKNYADLLASFTTNDAKVYVSQLEETEDRLLRHFQEAIQDAEDPGVRALLEAHMPQVRSCHDQMRTLKNSMQD